MFVHDIDLAVGKLGYVAIRPPGAVRAGIRRWDVDCHENQDNDEEGY